MSDVTWADWVGAYFRDPKQVFVAFAVDPESYLRIYPEFRVDEQARKRWIADRQGVLVGRQLAEMYGWKVGERIPIRSQIWINGESGDKSWEVNIDGILDTDDPRRDTRFMLMHWKYLDEARTFRRNTFGWAVLRTKGPEYNEKVARTIDAMFENSANATRTDTEAAFAKAFIDQLGNVGLIITSVVGAAMFTILLIAGTTMMLAVRERTREIAVMKTIGFSAGGVFAMVLAEAAMIAFLGGLGGLLVALGILEAAGQALAQYLPHLSMGAETWALGFGLMLALTLATGLPPAWNAMRLSIVAGLGWRS
ncbi:MAG: FtsX-like permease family protein [Alphaproteobacteria bacterium]|nr:MAG: FtsX-like permease family protein [Alphaproteobacteria bacterium]